MIQCQKIHTWQSFPHFHSTFPQPCGKLRRRTPEKLAQGTTVSYYTSKCSRILRFGKYKWYMRLYKMYMTDSKIYVRLRRVLAVAINTWQGKCRTFYRSYPRSLSSIITDLPGNAMYKMLPCIKWYTDSELYLHSSTRKFGCLCTFYTNCQIYRYKDIWIIRVDLPFSYGIISM